MLWVAEARPAVETAGFKILDAELKILKSTTLGLRHQFFQVAIF